MPVVVVVGAQWGDEGKGKVVDLYAQHADVVTRYGGGANAGHTLVVGGERIVLHLVPSGALHARTRCVIGQGVVVDPQVLLSELGVLRGRGLLDTPRVFMSDRAHVVLPHHRHIDELRERGRAAIGTTKRGIGPAYEDKAGRRGIRTGDLLDATRLAERVRDNLAAWEPVIRGLGGECPEVGPIVETLLAQGEALRDHITDASRMLTEAIGRGEKVLLEGAQGTMLDIDHGTYPYVTSSNVIAGGACAGAGIPPTAVDAVVGITKAYTTRVGGGPFPTELLGAEGEALREAGSEYGATTGRPRRCGWLDAAVVRFSARINGLRELALTKLDVLGGLQELRICTGYERDGIMFDEPPHDGLDRLVPVYETLPGWSGDLSACRRVEDLPDNARRYVNRIAELTGCPVGVVSVGADREQTLRGGDPFAR